MSVFGHKIQSTSLKTHALALLQMDAWYLRVSKRYPFQKEKIHVEKPHCQQEPPSDLIPFLFRSAAVTVTLHAEGKVTASLSPPCR